MNDINYLALLRGVNVGGKNKVSMAELKAVFVEHGFSAVSTYINSGNIFFSSDIVDKEELKRQCQMLINDKFNLEIIVVVITCAELISAIDCAPKWWGSDKEASHNAIFVIPPATAEELIGQVGIVPEYEKIDSHGNVIFWSAPLKTYSRTRWSKISGTSAYQSITVRNANSARKLAALSQRP